MMPEAFTLVNIGKINLDLASRKQGQRVAKRHRTVGERGGVDDNPIVVVDGLLYIVNTAARTIDKVI